MKHNQYTLIGIDGGATKVSGWVIDYLSDKSTYKLSDCHYDLPYASNKNHISNFTPVDIQTQLSQRENGDICLTDEESVQGEIYVEVSAQVIEKVYNLCEGQPLLIGIGMPGLKTTDQRGINAIANGPRMPEYCKSLENKLKSKNIRLLARISRLGSDADYCGVGEFYATDGSFRQVKNAYYLGGGTGAADALLLNGNLIPFDQIKSWMAKTWEMKNDLDLSFERYASASGLQYIFSRHSGKSVESLNNSSIYPPQIAELAIEGDQGATRAFKEVAEYLAILIFERITTLSCGSAGKLQFINANRDSLNPDHIYRDEVFERIIFGQRLGDLMASQSGKKVLTNSFLDNLSDLISNSNSLTTEIKSHYLQEDVFNSERLVFSKLREAPALGAGIDAHLSFLTENRK
jgi:predicted NBD/HSP70 family sugar kinase